MKEKVLAGIVFFGTGILVGWFAKPDERVVEQVIPTKSLQEKTVASGDVLSRQGQVDHTKAARSSGEVPEPSWEGMSLAGLRKEFEAAVKRNAAKEEWENGRAPKELANLIKMIFEQDAMLGIELSKQYLANEEGTVELIGWQHVKPAAAQSTEAFIETMRLTLESDNSSRGTFGIGEYPEDFDFKTVSTALEEMRKELPEGGGFDGYPGNLFATWVEKEPEEALLWLEETQPELALDRGYGRYPSLADFFESQGKSEEMGQLLGTLWNESAFEKNQLLDALGHSLQRGQSEEFFNGFVEEYVGEGRESD